MSKNTALHLLPGKFITDMILRVLLLFAFGFATASAQENAYPYFSMPLSDSTLISTNQTFAWSTDNTNALDWWLYVGTSIGGSELYDSGSLGASTTSASVGSLPVDGSMIHARLWYKTDTAWEYMDDSFTAYEGTSPSLILPLDGAELTGASQLFEWTDNGMTVDNWWLYAGTSQGGHQLHDSGNLDPTAYSWDIDNLPTDGSMVYIRLWYQLRSAWFFQDYTFSTSNETPELTLPESGSTLDGSSAVFSWESGGIEALAWWLTIGTSARGDDLYQGELLSPSTLSDTATGLPADGSTVHVGLWYKLESGWQFNDYTFDTAVSPPPDSSGIACVNAPAFEPPASSLTINVADEAALQEAVGNLQDNTRLLLAPGEYKLSRSLVVRADNITISGDSDRCDEVILTGSGMEDFLGDETVEYGIWIDSRQLAVSNLTIQQAYHHGIVANGHADGLTLYNVRLQDNGEQLLKVNPLGFADGVDNGLVEYSSFGYSDQAPITDHGGGTGYTKGIDVHGGKNWVIRNSLFENIHTPDWADHLWNPAVLMWNGSSDTLVENNRFHNVDRAIAFGLESRQLDHRGGVIRNNMISMDSGLFSSARRALADAMIIVWSSPDTKVLHNTILTQGNTPKSIELRFDSEHSIVENNLTDAVISSRTPQQWVQKNNLTNANISEFTQVEAADLRLNAPYRHYLSKGLVLDDATLDVDSNQRQQNADDLNSDIGAHEWLN